MIVRCIRTCTVPGKGVVEKGQSIEVDVFDINAAPYLKHFAEPSAKPVLVPAAKPEEVKAAPKRRAAKADILD